MDSSNLSSNWKQLQKSFQSQKSRPTQGVKRKLKDAFRGVKAQRPSKKRGMDGMSSKGPFSALSLGAKESGVSSAKPKDIPSSREGETIQLPNALTSPAIVRSSDVLNGGRTAGLEPGKYVALDCEMVGVGPNPETSSALARASLVDYNGAQLYDSFVLPLEPVTDFRTAVSGITPTLLKQARTFDQVQRDVADLLKGRILVGHAIRNDLKALMLGHPSSEIRDTSHHKAHRDLVNGARPALRLLASQLLGLEIQSGSHSSVEDARATMALFRRDKAVFEAEAAGSGPKPRPNGASATNGVRGSKRTGAKSKKKKRVKK